MSTRHPRVGATVALLAVIVAGGWYSSAVAAGAVKKTKHQKAIAKQADRLHGGLDKLREKGGSGPIREFFSDGKTVIMRLRIEVKGAGGKPIPGLKAIICEKEVTSDAAGVLAVDCPVSDAPFKKKQMLVIVDLVGGIEDARKAYFRGEEITFHSPGNVGFVIDMNKGRIALSRWDRKLDPPLAPSGKKDKRDGLKSLEEALAPPVDAPQASGVIVLEASRHRSAKNAWLQARDDFYAAILSEKKLVRKDGILTLAGNKENGLSVAIAALGDTRPAIASGGASVARQLGSSAEGAVQPLLGLMNNEKMAAETRWIAMDALVAIGEKESAALAEEYRQKVEEQERRRKQREDSDERIRTIPPLNGETVERIFRVLHEKYMLDAGTLWAESADYKRLNEFERKRYRETRPDEINKAYAEFSATEHMVIHELVFRDKIYDFSANIFKFETFSILTVGKDRGAATRVGQVCEVLLARPVVLPRVRYEEARAEALVAGKKTLIVRIQIRHLAYRERAMTETDKVNLENFQIDPPVGLSGEIVAVEFEFPDKELIYKTFE